MKKVPLLVELQPQFSGIRRAQRKEQIDGNLHIITIVGRPSGYRLIRTVVGSQHDEIIEDFRYLSDLFTFAKQMGFFEEVAPHASGWTGYSEWRLQEIRWSRAYESSAEDYSDYDEEEHIIILPEDEIFDDVGYEYSWDEPDDDEDYYWDE